MCKEGRRPRVAHGEPRLFPSIPPSCLVMPPAHLARFLGVLLRGWAGGLLLVDVQHLLFPQDPLLLLFRQALDREKVGSMGLNVWSPGRVCVVLGALLTNHSLASLCPLPSPKEHSPLENGAGPLHNPSFSGKGRRVKVNRGQPRWRPPILQGPTVASQQTVQSLARAQSPSIAGRHEARDPVLISTDTKPSTTPRVKQGPRIKLQASKPQGSPGVPPLQGWLPPAYLVTLLVVGILLLLGEQLPLLAT